MAWAILPAPIERTRNLGTVSTLLLCYNKEDVVWPRSKEEDDAVSGHVPTVARRKADAGGQAARPALLPCPLPPPLPCAAVIW